MENLLVMFQHPLQLGLAGSSIVMLSGLLFAEYYKKRFLMSPARLSLINPAEQRRMPRAGIPSRFKLEDASGQSDAAAELLNMSLGGACFASALPLEPGVRVSGTINASKDWLLRIAGQIVWSKPHGSHTLYGFEIKDAVHSRV